MTTTRGPAPPGAGGAAPGVLARLGNGVLPFAAIACETAVRNGLATAGRPRAATVDSLGAGSSTTSGSSSPSASASTSAAAAFVIAAGRAIAAIGSSSEDEYQASSLLDRFFVRVSPAVLLRFFDLLSETALFTTGDAVTLAFFAGGGESAEAATEVGAVAADGLGVGRLNRAPPAVRAFALGPTVGRGEELADRLSSDVLLPCDPLDASRFRFTPLGGTAKLAGGAGVPVVVWKPL